MCSNITLLGKTAPFIPQGRLTPFKDIVAFFCFLFFRKDIALWRLRVNTYETASFRNDDNMSEELSRRTKHHKPAWRISSRRSIKPLALSRVFILRTSHFTTIYSSSESIYVTVLILVRCFDTRTHKHAGPPVFPRTFPIFVLITALPLTWSRIYSRGVIRTQSCWAEREKDERRRHCIWIHPHLEHFQVPYVTDRF